MRAHYCGAVLWGGQIVHDIADIFQENLALPHLHDKLKNLQKLLVPKYYFWNLLSYQTQ